MNSEQRAMLETALLALYQLQFLQSLAKEAQINHGLQDFAECLTPFLVKLDEALEQLQRTTCSTD